MQSSKCDDLDLQMIEARLSGWRSERLPDLSALSVETAWADKAKADKLVADEAASDTLVWLNGYTNKSLDDTVIVWALRKEGLHLHAEEFLMVGYVSDHQVPKGSLAQDILSEAGGSAWYCSHCHAVSYPNRPCC